MYPKLNLPDVSFKISPSKQGDQRKQIFDIIRNKYVALTAEEWVRQHFVHFLIGHQGFPKSRIGVELSLKVYGLAKRADIVVYNKLGEVEMIVECKSFDFPIKESTFDQVANYNLPSKSKYLVVTNGMDHFCCKMDYNNSTYEFCQEIPFYKG